MTKFDEGLIRMVDARIEAALRRTEAYGTVASRDTAGPGAMVTMDGSTVAVPAKVFGHVHTFEGDRVALVLIENKWCVVGTFARRQLAEASSRGFGPVGNQVTSSSTYVDMPGPTQIASFNKRYDGTGVRFQILTTMWASVVDTYAQVAVRMAGQAGTETASTFTAVDIYMGRIELDTAFVRGTIACTIRQVIPAGDYTFTARWRRASGTGELRQDDHDQTSLEADEVFRTASN